MNFLPREKWENGEVPEIIVTPEDYGSELDLGCFGVRGFLETYVYTDNSYGLVKVFYFC